MKKILILSALLISGLTLAQNKEPKLETVGNKVKVTYFFENGQIQQEGFFKNGKLEGKWVSYDLAGNRKSIGEYEKGARNGKWFFWNDATLSEVDYSNSQITEVKNWKQCDALVTLN
ncbi:MAG: membrane-binding protein [Flavobacterium sp.]|jgi:antitoxin component YwqK of YwqJK toxin-antitoxin module|nr:membrane-binding protein [Flavobacterium sp.]